MRLQGASPTTNPILVYTRRGSLVENRFRGAYVVLDSRGTLITAAGHFREAIFARSSLKPINVLAMLLSGAAEHFKVTDEEIALACSSHSGEEQHVQKVKSWLERIGCSPEELACGTHAPIGTAARKSLYSRSEKPTALHNACSGKHAGFLTLTKFRGHKIKDYTSLEHPTQREVMETAAHVLGLQVNECPKGIDGCQIPMLGMSMENLAYGMARLVDPKTLTPAYQEACRRVTKAMLTYPHLVAGEKRFCTTVIEETQGEVLVKMGADGVFSGAVPKKKWGIALKMDDGNGEAAEVAMINLLKRLKLLPEEKEEGSLKPWLQKPLRNWCKEPVGHYYSAF